MGLSESKSPFESDGRPSTPQVDHEIGISQMIDPRSPSNEFERTPLYYRNETARTDEEDIGVVVEDPRSPSNEIKRTPIAVDSFENTATDEDVDNALRVQIQRLKLLDNFGLNPTDSSESLLGVKDIINPTKTVLELLDEEPSPNMDWMCFPYTPPKPRSRSSPNPMSGSIPGTPGLWKKETDCSIEKQKRSHGRRRNKSSQQTKVLKPTLKNVLTDHHATRSPLTERNGEPSDHSRLSGKKSIKTATFVKYKKYNALEESFTGENFGGKENEDVVW